MLCHDGRHGGMRQKIADLADAHGGDQCFSLKLHAVVMRWMMGAEM